MPPSRHRLWVTLPLLPAPPRRPAPHLCPPAHVPAAPGREPSFLLVSEVACPCVADPSGSRRQSEPNSPRLQGDTDAQRRRLGSAQGRSGNVRCTGPSLCAGATPTAAGQGGEAVSPGRAPPPSLRTLSYATAIRTLTIWRHPRRNGSLELRPEAWAPRNYLRSVVLAGWFRDENTVFIRENILCIVT